MKRAILVVAGALGVLGAGGIGCGAATQSQSGGASVGLAGGATGARATDFTLRDVDGRTVHLSDYLGKNVVLVNFWATWCAPCAGELPHLERLYETYKAKGFVVLSISMDGPES